MSAIGSNLKKLSYLRLEVLTVIHGIPLFAMSAIGLFHSNIFINDFGFINAVVLVSLLVSLKILHKFFKSFYYLP